MLVLPSAAFTLIFTLFSPSTKFSFPLISTLEFASAATALILMLFISAPTFIVYSVVSELNSGSNAPSLTLSELKLAFVDVLAPAAIVTFELPFLEIVADFPLTS